jgi:two-component system, cell cycle sensor histidine kinase and response regulator CckA
MNPYTKQVVLVVDDDETVRKVLRTGLERDGFEVLTAEHGVDALDVMRRFTRRIDVLLADVVMPEMGGVELAEKVLTLNRPPRVILMSGIIHDPSKVRIGGHSPPFVQKPFNMSGLMKLVHREAEMGS